MCYHIGYRLCPRTFLSHIAIFFTGKMLWMKSEPFIYVKHMLVLLLNMGMKGEQDRKY